MALMVRFVAAFPSQVPKPEKHGSGTDSDYDNTQTYDLSLRSDPLYTQGWVCLEIVLLIASTKYQLFPVLCFIS